MKKSNFTKLFLIGMASGSLLSPNFSVADKKPPLVMNDKTHLFAACMSHPWSTISDFCKSVQNPHFNQRSNPQTKRMKLLAEESV